MDKKEKKHSNKKTVLITLGGFVVFCVVAMIITGAWNPFKSKEVSEEARVAYEKSDEQAADIFSDIADFTMKEQDADEISPDYRENGIYPNGFEVKDYGEEGEDGVLKSYDCAVYTDFQEIYGLGNFFIYYMKNDDYANEKFSAVKGGLGGGKIYKGSDGSKVSFGKDGGGELSYIIFQKNSVVYNGMLSENKNDYLKIKKLFDKIGIDFNFPDYTTLK
ncbi:MAG: hypothetical protein Q4Q31_06040 [Bacillota bacterium]|nr:hypothetical protein [Bacillota bacterium]